MSISFTALMVTLFFTISSFAQESEKLPPPRSVDSRLECKTAFKNLFPDDVQGRYEMACHQQSVRDLILEKTNPPSAEKTLFLQCLNYVRGIKNIPDSFVADCADEATAHALLNPEYPKCFKATDREFGPFDAYQECQNATFLVDYKSDAFAECRSRLKSLKQDSRKILELCKNQEDRSRIISKNFEFCQEELESARSDSNTIVFFCNRKETLETMGHANYKNCRVSVGNMTRNKNVGIGLCSFSPALLDLVQKNPACIHRSVQSAYKNYVIYSAYAVKRTGDGSEKNYFLSLISDCGPEKLNKPENSNKIEAEVPANAHVRLLKDFNLHTSELIEFVGGPKPFVQVGGASALNYDAKNEVLYVLSDEAYMHSNAPARMYLYDFNKKLELRDSKTIPFTYGDADSPHVDGEGLVRLKDGRFIVSSEVGESNPRRSDHNGRRVIPSMNLNLFSRDASYLTYIPLPESFRSKYLRVVEKSYLKQVPLDPNEKPAKTDIPDRPEKSSSKGGKADKKGSKKDSPPVETITTESVVDERLDFETARDGGKFTVPKAWLYLYGTSGMDEDSSTPYEVKISHYIVAGLQYNKSVESLGLSPDESTLFLANEASLFQDMKHKTKCIERKPFENGEKRASVCRQMIRIARMSRVEAPETFRPFDEFKYELEAEIDNGVSEILPLSSLELLVLERSWDVEKQKVTARIFKVTLAAESQIPKGASVEQVGALPPLKKKLILDLDQVIPQLSPGLRTIDNFEGMTFGPTLENGNRTLLLVTDNNFSRNQKTLLLVFEILQDLVEKKP